MPIKSYRYEFEKRQLVKTGIDAASDEVLAMLKITKDELKQAAKKLQGRFSIPGMPEFKNDVKEVFFVEDHPKIIIFCSSWQDVKMALELARSRHWEFVCRSGGHSTAGFSTSNSMILDVSGINDVVVDPLKLEMTVGAGANFRKIDPVLDAYRVHVPGGGCSTVGIAGFMQGGGYGFTSRQFGINCDSVIEITMMLADGRVVVASQSKNADLFWAVRGGTGNNFGVLLQIKYKVYPLNKLWGFILKWPLEKGAPALMEMQRNFMNPETFSKVNYQTVIGTLNKTFNEQPAVLMLGMYDGTKEEGMNALASLRDVPGSAIMMDTTDSYFNLNRNLLNVLNPPLPELKLHEFKRSSYISKYLQLSDWEKIINHFSIQLNKYNLIVLEPYGGSITRPVMPNAFIHREVSADLWIDSFFDDAEQTTSKPVAEKWINDFMNLSKDLFNGHIYQNYPVRDLPNFRWAYWGDAFNSLLFVKKKFDKENFFHFPQSISDYPDCDSSIKKSQVPSVFDDTEITYEPYFQE